jgi:hypothetical protein
MEEVRNTYKIFIAEAEKKDHLENLGVDKKILRVDLRGTAYDGMNLQIP